MRIGVFGDIHNNFEALTACYQVFMEEGVDSVVCTGDVVGYGGSPVECLDFMMEHDIPCVKGNHDYYTTHFKDDWDIQPYAKTVIRWMQDTLDSKYIDWLDALPYSIEIESVSFVHASLEVLDGSSWPYILNAQSAMFHFFMQKTKICFFGHTHIPLLFKGEGGAVTFELLTSGTLPEKSDLKLLLNPGSVGQPRDFDSRAAVVIFDTEDESVELYRVEYDIDAAQNRIVDAGLPLELARRLSSGR
jgi:predicted phosphodiesterase